MQMIIGRRWWWYRLTDHGFCEHMENDAVECGGFGQGDQLMDVDWRRYVHDLLGWSTRAFGETWAGPAHFSDFCTLGRALNLTRCNWPCSLLSGRALGRGKHGRAWPVRLILARASPCGTRKSAHYSYWVLVLGLFFSLSALLSSTYLVRCFW